MLILCCLDERNLNALTPLIPEFAEHQNVSVLTPPLLNSFQPDAIITQLSLFTLSQWDRIAGNMESGRILLIGCKDDSHSSIAAMAQHGVIYCQSVTEKKIRNFLLSCCRENLSSETESGDNMGIIGTSRCIRKIRRDISLFAPLNDTVIILGETGTGKDITARALHFKSGRTGAFLPVNCSAIPETLIESEIFGAVKGAYTGADRNSSGYLRAADRGTLFLDEIGDMPLYMQTKLLRVLEDKRVTPLGSTQSHMVDVRIITATSRDITTMMDRGKFRKDLYYRLNILKIRVPGLAERKSDIPQLAGFFLSQNSSVKKFSPDAMMKLLEYHWPGNVRELKTIIRRAEIMSGDLTLIESEHISFR